MDSTISLQDTLSDVRAFTGQLVVDGTPGQVADSRLFTSMPAHEYH